MSNQFPFKQLLSDKQFWLAILAGPFFWLSLYSSGQALRGFGWIQENLFVFLQLVLLYPVLEEIVFRGLLQESLWRTKLSRLSVYCVSAPNITTALLFTLFHFFNHNPGWALVVFFPALVFGYFRDRYNHVIPAILLHVFYNAGYFALFGN